MSADPFRWLAPVYETVELLYSGGAIGVVKRAQWEIMTPGQRVCYAGVGAGGEIWGAVARGALVTVIDSSAAMLAQIDAGRAPSQLEKVHASVLDWQPSQPFDVLVTNFFLNVFEEKGLKRVLDKLADWVRPGGIWTIADFCPPKNLLARLYWSVPLRMVAPFTGEDLHPFYDYLPLLQSRGFVSIRENKGRLFGLGPSLYRLLMHQKQEPKNR